MIDTLLATKLIQLYTQPSQGIQSHIHELYLSQGPQGLSTLHDQSLQYQAHLIQSQKNIEVIQAIEKTLNFLSEYSF